jgi:hypothetical protein
MIDNHPDLLNKNCGLKTDQTWRGILNNENAIDEVDWILVNEVKTVINN